MAISVTSGIHRGIQILSTYNVYLALYLIAALLLFGPALFISNVYLESFVTYAQKFFTLSAYRGGESWLGGWIIFFFAWYLGYGPMKAIFIICTIRRVESYSIGTKTDFNLANVFKTFTVVILYCLVINMIIKSFFINLSILVTFLFIYTQLSSEKPLTMKSSAGVKILTGLFGGVLSNVLMQFSIHIDTVIFDLRQIPLIALAYFGGALPASIAVILTVGGRFLISIDTMTYLSAVVSIAGALFACLFSRTRYPTNFKIFIVVSFNSLILSIFYILMSQQSALSVKILIIYWVISYIAAYLSFYLLYYIRHTQTLFKKYQQDSVTDWLTGLNNHRKFDQAFNDLVDWTKKKQQKLSLLYIDIDHFKRVNDQYGHVEGDVVLSTLGMILKKNMKDNDVVCRIGGEEFSLLFVDYSLKESYELAEKIRKDVESHLFRLDSGEDIRITISIGVACYPQTTSLAEQLRADADEALYKAKNTGRNRVCVAGQDT